MTSLTSNRSSNSRKAERDDMTLTVARLINILRKAPGDAQVYVLNQARETYDIRTIEVEHPGDDSEGEICINIAVDGE